MLHRLILSLLTMLAFSTFLLAQTQEGGLPLGLTAPDQLLPAPLLELTGPDREKLRKEDEAKPGNRFAAPVAVDIDIHNQGNWSILSDGTQVWQLRLRVPDAQGLLLFYEDFNLPEGGKVYVYAPQSHQVLGAYTGASRQRSDRLFTGVIKGEEVIVEYQAPADDFSSPFHIWRVDVVYKDGPEKDLLNFGFGSSRDCHDNAACAVADEWQNERNAVARIIVVVEEGSGYCTGTLMNNTAEDGRLLLLSAFHCMDTYTPLYDLWRFDFYYAAADCNDPATEPGFTSILGCDSLAGRQAVDFLLLDLYEEEADGMELYFAGWDHSGTPPDSAAILHHPRGDIQKFAKADNSSAYVFPNSINWNNGVTTPPNHHYRLTYTDGTMEVGSSGGSLFDKNHRIVAQLHGDAGTTTCNATNGYFGRLSVAWDGDNEAVRLKDWLDPLGLEVEQFDALTGLRSALVKTGENVPVPGVAVSFYHNDQFIATTNTGINGRIPVPENIPATGNLRMEFTKSGSYSNGVSIIDLIQIQKQILTTELLAPYRLLACDVNNSNSLTTLDMIRIRKLILTLDPDFGDGGVASWQFFSATQTFPNPQDPWANEPRDNSFEFTLNAGLRLPDFITVKSGDANGNADL